MDQIWKPFLVSEHGCVHIDERPLALFAYHTHGGHDGGLHGGWADGERPRRNRRTGCAQVDGRVAREIRITIDELQIIPYKIGSVAPVLRLGVIAAEHNDHDIRL